MLWSAHPVGLKDCDRGGSWALPVSGDSCDGATLIEMIAPLPAAAREQVAEHPREYVPDLLGEGRWEEPIPETQPGLVEAERKARMAQSRGPGWDPATATSASSRDPKGGNRLRARGRDHRRAVRRRQQPQGGRAIHPERRGQGPPGPV